MSLGYSCTNAVLFILAVWKIVWIRVGSSRLELTAAKREVMPLGFSVMKPEAREVRASYHSFTCTGPHHLGMRGRDVYEKFRVSEKYGTRLCPHLDHIPVLGDALLRVELSVPRVPCM